MTGLLPTLDRVIGLSGGALDLLMPMHVWFAQDGTIVQAGPTIHKMAQRETLAGHALDEVLEIRKPLAGAGPDDLLEMSGERLTLTLAVAPDLPLRATVASLPGGVGGILNLSLGLSFARAVSEFSLTLSDFSPCDQTVELLYLQEANAATARESRKLTERLLVARRTAEEQALTDTLTGLPNRRALEGYLTRLMQTDGARFAVMNLDLDYFKQVNDSRGHAAGDHVLANVGTVLRSEMRHGDMAARVGGDEFILVFRDCNDAQELGRIAARLIARLEEPLMFEGEPCRISGSIGIALADHPEATGLEALLQQADVALYRSKLAGRAQHSIYGEAEAPDMRA